MKNILCLCAILMMFSFVAKADIPQPPTPKPTPNLNDKATRVPMTIRVNPNVNETTLKIPKSLVKDLRAALDEAENGNQTTAAVTSFNVTPTQTIMGGLFMSVALIIGGMCLFRAKPIGTTAKVAGGLIIAAMFGASATIIFGNTAPPAYKGIDADVFSNKMQNHWNGAFGNVKVEISDEKYYDEKGRIILLVPRGSGDGKTEE